MKQEQYYSIYCEDTDGSERKVATIKAGSPQEAVKKAKNKGFKKILEAVIED